MKRAFYNSIVRAPLLAAAVLTAFIAVFSLVGCGGNTPALSRPEYILVCTNGVESRYSEGDHDYEKAYDLLKGTRLDGVLETAVDQEAGLKDFDCIEFVYDDLQRIESGSAAREYDRLLFCFAGPYAGEVVLGVDERYVSGTYKLGTTAWPY